MGSQTIVHGRILLAFDASIQEAIDVISSLANDDNYPWIRTEMFSHSTDEKPYFYDNNVLAFAATYKGLDDEFKSFVLKFEAILSKLQFETAKIQLETAYYGTYDFFWQSKRLSSSIWNKQELEENSLLETESWYFGFGRRGWSGLLEEQLSESQILRLNFSYPISFDPTALEEVNSFISSLCEEDIGKEIGLRNKISDKTLMTDELRHVLVFLEAHGKIRFGLGDDGYWIVPKERIVEVGIPHRSI